MTLLFAIAGCNSLEHNCKIGLEFLDRKFRSFDWYCIESDGHNQADISKALKSASNTGYYRRRGKPTVVIFNTVKGKGVSFMENSFDWHYKIMNKEEFESAFKEVS